MPLVAWRTFLCGAARRLPVEAAATALGALAAIVAIHQHHPELTHLRVTFAALLTVPLAFAARERAGRYGAALGAALGAAALAVVHLTLPDADALERSDVRWGLGLFALAAALAPFAAAGPRFAQLARRFFEELTTGAVLGGLALIAELVVGFALEELLGLPTKRLTADAMVLTAAAMLLLGIDRLHPDRAEPKTPALWRRLALAVGAPFVATMLVILAIYEASLLARGELPQNLLSPLLITAGFVGYGTTIILGAIVAEPVGDGPLAPAEPHRFLRLPTVRLARAFPVVLLALLPMALAAVLLRIDQYGLTPFRVVRLAALACLSALALAGTWRWLRGQPALSWQVPALVAAVAVALAVGPTSAVALSVRSQTARLERLLAAAGAPSRQVDARPAGPARELEHAAFAELEDAIATVAELGGEAALARVLHGPLERCLPRWSGPQSCLESLGLASTSTRPDRYYRAEAQAPVATLAGELEFFSAYPGGRYDLVGQSLQLPAEAGAALASVPLTNAVAAALAERPLPASALPVIAADGRQLGVVVLQRFDVSAGRDGVSLIRLDGVWVRTSR